MKYYRNTHKLLRKLSHKLAWHHRFIVRTATNNPTSTVIRRNWFTLVGNSRVRLWPGFLNDWYARYEYFYEDDGGCSTTRVIPADSTQAKRLGARKNSERNGYSPQETFRLADIHFPRPLSLRPILQKRSEITPCAAMVNKHCEGFELFNLSSDQFEALRLCGLQSPKDAERSPVPCQVNKRVPSDDES